jgi:hypothetical protein
MKTTRKMWGEDQIYTAIPQTLFQKSDAKWRKKLKLAPRFPVIVIDGRPENVKKLRAEIRQVINWWMDGESDFQTCLERTTDDVLSVLRVTNKKRRK